MSIRSTEEWSRADNGGYLGRMAEITLEQFRQESLEFLADDELLEVTPKHLRLRKRERREVHRRKEARRLRREQNGRNGK